MEEKDQAQISEETVTESARVPGAGDDSYFRLLVENAYDVIVVLNADGTVRYTSPAIGRVLGYGHDELVGINPLEIVHPEDAGLILGLFENVRSEPGRTGSNEFRFRRKDGSWCILEGIAKNLLDEPRIAGHVVNLRDITEYRRIEEELRESEERYRSLVENLNEVVFTCDEEGRFNFVSPVIERLSKFRMGELLEQPFQKYVYPKDLPGILDSFQRTLSGSVESHEFRFVDKDGRLIYFEVSIRPLERGDKVVGVVGMLSEITDRKQAEEIKKRTEEMLRAQIRKSIRYYRAP